MINALSEHTDVPVPPVHWFEDDESVLGAPFFVMGKVEGNVPSDNPPYTQTGWLLEEATPAVRRTVVENGLDALAADPPDRLAQARPRLPRQAAVRRARASSSRSRTTSGPSSGRRRAGRSRSRRRRSTGCRPTSRRATQDLALAWGDARINNQMFDEAGNVVAVFDWEMVTLADPMMDLAWWLFLDRHFHEGMPAGRDGGAYGTGPPGSRASRGSRRGSRWSPATRS